MRGPWYISVSAVRDYLWLLGRPDATDGPDFDRAENELIEIATARAQNGTPPKQMDNGLLQYRLGRAHGRMALIVGPGERSKPALVAVESGNAGGRGRGPHRNSSR